MPEATERSISANQPNAATSEGEAPYSFLPQLGERALVVGQTGSGKSVFEKWLLEHHDNSPIVIYDTKIEPKFDSLKASHIVSSVAQANEAIDDDTVDYVIFRPSISVSGDPQALDNLLLYHYHNWNNVSCFIDELYPFVNAGRAGEGLRALLTRGRSRAITTVMCSQRPKWVSLFAITEAQKYYIFRLVQRRDRQALEEVIPDFSDLPVPPKYHFYFFEHGMEKAKLYKPIDIDPSSNTGYTDSVEPLGDGSGVRERYVWI